MILPKCIRSSEICDIVPFNYCVLGGKLTRIQYWPLLKQETTIAELNIIYLSLNISPLKL